MPAPTPIDSKGFEFVREAGPGVWSVVVIKAGTSKNGNAYPAEVLEEAAPLFEGRPLQIFDLQDGQYSHLPIKLQRAIQGGIIKSTVGVLRGAKWDATKGAITAEAVITSPWLVEFLNKVSEAVSGPVTAFGLSISAVVDSVKEATGRAIKSFKWVESVDVVTSPAAGGAFVRALEAHYTEESMDEKQIRELIAEAVKGLEADDAAIEAIVKSVMEANTDDGAVKALEAKIDALEAEAKATAHKSRITNIVEGLVPAGAVDLVVGNVVTESSMDASDEDLRKIAKGLSALFDSPAPKGRIEVAMESADKVQSAMDKLMGVADDDQGKDGVKPFRGIQEAYVEMTGDKELTQEVQEANTISSSFTVALGLSMHKRVRKAYNSFDFGAMRLVSTEQAVSDFKAHSIIGVGGFADLDTVAEAGSYTEQVVPGEEAPTVSVTKKGNLIPVSWEAIRNDDMGIVTRRADALGRAGIRTLSKAIFAVQSGNAAIWTTDTLYHANHSNTGTTALSYASILAAENAIAAQTEKSSSEPLGIEPSQGGLIVVPRALRPTAFELIGNADLKPGTANNDASALMWGKDQVLVNPFASDANNWYMVADPKMYEWLVVSYLDGKTEPEVLTANAAQDYSMWNKDLIEYKVRHVWGLSVVDYRSTYGQIVA